MLQRFTFTLLLLLLAGAAEAQEPDVLWIRGGGAGNDAAWAPDGTTFALATRDGTLQVFDSETRLLVQTIRAHDLEVTEIAYTPDGNRLAANGERYASGAWTFLVGVWDRATGEAVWTAPVATRVFGIDVSADGAVVAVGHRQGVSLYDAATGALMQTLQTPREVKDVKFSPDGQHLAASALIAYFGREIWLWRTADWGLARTLTNGLGYPELAFSPDGSMLAAAGEFESFTSIRGEIKLWDVASGQLVRTINMGETNTGAEGPGFSPDGQRVFAGHPFLGVKVYEVATGALVSHLGHLEHIRLAPDGQTFLAPPNRCGAWYTWAAFSFPNGQLIDDFMTHDGAVYNLDVSDDGSMIATGDGSGARVWDAATAERLHEFLYTCSGNIMRTVAFSPDQATLAGAGLCWDCEIKLWDLPTGQQTVLPLGHRALVSALAFSPDGTELASGSSYVQSLVVSVPDGFLVHGISTGAVNDLAYSADGARLAFGTWSNGIRIADAATGAVIRTIPNPHDGAVRRVAFTPDRSHLLSSGDDGRVKVWETATGALVRTIEAHPGPVMALALTPDGRHVLSGGNDGAGPAKLWDLATGALLHTYGEETTRMMDAEFFPDGATFAFARWDALGVARNVAAQAAVAVSAQPVGGPVVIGPGGGSFQYTVTLTNQTAQPQSFQAWTAVTGPVAREPVVGPQSVTLPPGATVTKTLTQRVPGNAPPGTYTYHVRLGTLGGTVLASGSFPFQKQGAAAAARGGDDLAGWAASGALGGDDAATASAALPGGFALSEAHPNPSGGATRLTLEVAAAQHVRAEVYDALGRRVAVLLDGTVEEGTHALVLDPAGAGLPAGVYVIRVTGEAFAATRRLTLVK